MWKSMQNRSHFVRMLVPPDATSIVLGASNNRIPLIVERA